MKKIIKLDQYTIDEVNRLIGNREENIDILEKAFETNIIVRGDEIHIDDDENKITSNTAVASATKSLEFDLPYSYYSGQNYNLFIICNL